MYKPESHLEILILSLIASIPATLAIIWKREQKKLNREPHAWEYFIILFFGTMLFLYLFYFLLNN
jgi:hypothetical protein